MSNIIKENKRLILLVILSPIIVYFSTVVFKSIFDIGISVGTFLRHLYHYIVC